MSDNQRPASPSVADKSTSTYSPDQLNPDLASMAMAREYAKKWPTPTIVSKKFTVFYGMWSALNHVEPQGEYPGNPTYYDCSYRLSVYNGAGVQSVNTDGKLFNSLFALWMKPQYIIQGMPLLSGGGEQAGGLMNWIRGKLGGGNKPQEAKQQ